MFDNILEVFDTLLDNYIKIIKVNLLEDSYEIVKICPDENTNYSTNSFSSWLFNFVEDGNVFSEDIDYYKFNTRLSYIQNYFIEGNSCLTIKYRKKIGNEFHWVSTEIIKTKDYSEKNQSVYLMIRDIDASYANELESQRQLEHFCYYDSLTELKNFHSYKEICAKFEALPNKNSVGAIFSDVNGLKVINDTQGHEAGNNLLLSYSILLTDIFKGHDIFRISGDEFVVLFQNIKKEEMEKAATRLISHVEKCEMPIASIGYAWNEGPSNIENVVKIAEANMYLDKQIFYKKFPEYRRNKTSEIYNGELEDAILTLTKVYPTVGIINMLDDTYRMICMDAIVGDPIDAPSFTEYNTEFLATQVHPDSLKHLKPFVGISNLKVALENQESVTLTFKTKDNHFRQITYMVLERTDDNVISRVLFYAHEMNEYISNEFANLK